MRDVFPVPVNFIKSKDGLISRKLRNHFILLEKNGAGKSEGFMRKKVSRITKGFCVTVQG